MIPLNDRNAFIKNAIIRNTNPTSGKALLISSDCYTFQVDTGGTAAPLSAKLKANPFNMPGAVCTWSATGGAWLGGNTDNERTLTYTAGTTFPVKVSASVTYEGNTYNAVDVTITKVVAQASTPGVAGQSVAIVLMYKGSTAAVSLPTGKAIFSWQTGKVESYDGPDGWSSTPPANPNVAGWNLWVAAKSITASNVSSSEVTFTPATANLSSWSRNGDTGPAGTRTSVARAYQWVNGPAPTATGTSVLTWASGDYNNLPGAGWSKTKPEAPAKGYTLYELSVGVMEANGATSTTFSWGNGSIVAVGYLGTDGAPGGSGGASILIAYTLVNGSSLANTPSTITVNGKNPPPANAWGTTNPWQLDSPPANVAAGQSVFQSIGTYDPVSLQAVWGLPFLAGLRVGSLNAITTNTGDLTVTGTLSSANNLFTVTAAGLVTMRAAQLIAADGTVLFSTGTGLTEAGAAPGTKNSELAPVVNNLVQNNVPTSLAGYTAGAGNIADGAWSLSYEANSYWTPRGTGCIYVFVPQTTPVNSYVDVYGIALDVIPGERYEFGVAVSAHRCIGGVYVAFFGADGGQLSNTGLVEANSAGGPAAASRDTHPGDAFPRASMFVTMPANVVKARMTFRLMSNGGYDQYTMFSEMYAGRASAAQKVPSKYTELSSVTLSAAATAAKNAAAAAQQAADTANAAVAVISSDSIMSRSEKPEIEREWGVISGEFVGITGQADALVLDRANYTNSFYALQNYLAAIPYWGNRSIDSPINPGDFQSAFTNLYLARQALLNAIAAKAATLSVWDGVANRPMEPTNLVRTPTFEDMTLGTWSGVPGVSLRGNGAQSPAFPHKAGIGVSTRDTVPNNSMFTVKPGERLYASATIHSGSTDLGVHFGAVFYNNAGQITAFLGAAGVAGRSNFWSNVKGAMTVPEGASQAQPWIQMDGFNNFGSAEITNMVISRAEPGATVGAEWNVNVVGAAAVNANIAAAQQSADASNAELALIASDNVLSKGEKSQVVKEWETLYAEKDGIYAQADALGVNKVAYVNSVNDLANYLVSLNPSWSDTRYDTAIDATTFRFRFRLVYQEKQAVLNAMSTKIQANVDYVNGRATDAQNAANAAQQSANTANTALGNIASDNVLSRSEKSGLILQWQKVSDERPDIVAKADALGVDRGGYLGELQNLSNYLVAMSPGWDDVTQDTGISGADFRYRWSMYFAARQWLLNAIALKAATMASWSGVSGAGKPADNATVGGTFGPNGNIGGQMTVAQVPNYIPPNSITNTLIGGNLQSSNWNGNTGTGGAGWMLERSTGNLYGNSLRARGAIMGGAYVGYAWPGTGATGFYLGPEGLLLGNYSDGRFFQIESNGNITAPGFTIVNGAATFSGNLAAPSGSFGNIRLDTGAINAGDYTGWAWVNGTRPDGVRKRGFHISASGMLFGNIDYGYLQIETDGSFRSRNLTFDATSASLTVKGEILGSKISTSVLSIESARILTAWSRLAPFSLYDTGMQYRTTIGYCTVTLPAFVGPVQGDVNTYDSRRFGSFKKDVFLKATMNGDTGYDTLLLEVAYHNNGSFATLGSARANCNYFGGFTLILRYTPAEGGWDYITFRARTTEGRALNVAFEVQVYNFNESGNEPYSTSAISENPSSGSGGTRPPIDEWCVDAETTKLPDGRFVRDVKVDDLMACWNFDAENPGIEYAPANSVKFGEEYSLMIVTERGVQLIQSKSTPMNTRDGRVILTPELEGEEVLVNRKGVLTWEKVIQLHDMGLRSVVKVSLHDRMYFAGLDPKATIATHNQQYKP